MNLDTITTILFIITTLVSSCYGIVVICTKKVGLFFVYISLSMVCFFLSELCVFLSRGFDLNPDSNFSIANFGKIAAALIFIIINFNYKVKKFSFCLSGIICTIIYTIFSITIEYFLLKYYFTGLNDISEIIFSIPCYLCNVVIINFTCLFLKIKARSSAILINFIFFLIINFNGLVAPIFYLLNLRSTFIYFCIVLLVCAMQLLLMPLSEYISINIEKDNQFVTRKILNN